MFAVLSVLTPGIHKWHQKTGAGSVTVENGRQKSGRPFFKGVIRTSGRAGAALPAAAARPRGCRARPGPWPPTTTNAAEETLFEFVKTFFKNTMFKHLKFIS